MAHTIEQDFQHFMAYTNSDRADKAKLRVAYEHGAKRRSAVSDAQLGAMAVIYGSGYRHGHESTVEGGYTDVVHYDRASYWLDTVREMIEEDDDLRAAMKGETP